MLKLKRNISAIICCIIYVSRKPLILRKKNFFLEKKMIYIYKNEKWDTALQICQEIRKS